MLITTTSPLSPPLGEDGRFSTRKGITENGCRASYKRRGMIRESLLSFVRVREVLTDTDSIVKVLRRKADERVELRASPIAHSKGLQ